MLVTRVLCGWGAMESEPGKGTTFSIAFPVTTPVRTEALAEA